MLSYKVTLQAASLRPDGTSQSGTKKRKSIADMGSSEAAKFGLDEAIHYLLSM